MVMVMTMLLLLLLLLLLLMMMSMMSTMNRDQDKTSRSRHRPETQCFIEEKPTMGQKPLPLLACSFFRVSGALQYAICSLNIIIIVHGYTLFFFLFRGEKEGGREGKSGIYSSRVGFWPIGAESCFRY
ncbi:hypothetical protein FN846DRAFT_984591 [Sphaerosporella brunnea]|uniref:Copper transporter n=1 Tax=Sphaerosporella brunnea TaxID=1250544 RepID=A0A5J5EVE3_9PEZI|nr:hypothetical protein FN846DRAFT_984591 [Sphaerosporella brunnea]